jgi:hypothetical protein
VLWRPSGAPGGSRFTVRENEPWQDFERQAKLQGHPWSADQEMLEALLKKA